MPAPPKLRCPACGSLAKAPDFANAGSHHIEVRRVLRGLGRAKGFLWSREVPPPAALRFVLSALDRAAGQIQHLIATITSEPPTCPSCGIGLAWNAESWSWQCTSCGATWPG